MIPNGHPDDLGSFIVLLLFGLVRNGFTNDNNRKKQNENETCKSD